MSERQTTGEFKIYSIGKKSGKTYNKVQEMAKEIVRLQKENENALILIEQYSNERENILKGEFISKDIIRDKIKELEENLDDDFFRDETMAQISVLKELLGESNE